MLGVSKPAVYKRIKAASAAIWEKIDLDRHTPEEPERKADKRQRAERKVVRLKRRKPAPRVEDPTPPADHMRGDRQPARGFVEGLRCARQNAPAPVHLRRLPAPRLGPLEHGAARGVWAGR